MAKAEVGQTVKTKSGVIGIVEKVYENSVMIKIIRNSTSTLYPNGVTIVNHKNYTVVTTTA